MSELVHTPDFRSACWRGETFCFTRQQASIIEVLHTWGEQGCLDLGEDFLLVESGSSAKQLRSLFRGHKAWNSLLVRGQTNGTRRLACFGKKV